MANSFKMAYSWFKVHEIIFIAVRFIFQSLKIESNV